MNTHRTEMVDVYADAESNELLAQVPIRSAGEKPAGADQIRIATDEEIIRGAKHLMQGRLDDAASLHYVIRKR